MSNKKIELQNDLRFYISLLKEWEIIEEAFEYWEQDSECKAEAYQWCNDNLLKTIGKLMKFNN